MRLDRLRSGLLSGPLPEAGATLELQGLPQTQMPVTTQVMDTIGPNSWIPYDVERADKMFGGYRPPDITDIMARARLGEAMRQRDPPPEIKSPEVGMELSELSNIVQGKSMGWTEDQARKYYERKGGAAREGGADLPSRPTGPVVTAPETDDIANEMKGPLQQLQFLDPRYRGGWF